MEWTRIYLDTNILEELQWPLLTVRLRNLLRFAQFFGIETCLSEAVEQEAEEHLIRAIREEREKAQKKITPLIQRVGLQADIALAAEEELRKEHRALVASVKSRYGLLSTRLTNQTLDWFFQKAIRHTPPFVNRGTNFQDFVILMSVIDHLKEAPTKLAALVTSDRGFTGADVAVHANEAGVALRIVRLDEIYKKLEEERTTLKKDKQANELKATWERQKSYARGQMEAFYPEMEGLIIRYLNEAGGTDPRYQLVELKWLRVTGIKSVDLPFPEPDVSPADIQLTTRVQVKYLAAMRHRVPYPDEVILHDADFQAEKEDEFDVTASATVKGDVISDIHDLSVGQVRRS